MFVVKIVSSGKDVYVGENGDLTFDANEAQQFLTKTEADRFRSNYAKKTRRSIKDLKVEEI